MNKIQDLQTKLKAEQEALAKAKQRLQAVRAFKQKVNKAYEMFESIKDEYENAGMESQLKAL
jgi:phosphopantetheine adenylyltransferase